MTTNQAVYRRAPEKISCVEEGQFRIGPQGMIKVCPARQEIRDVIIHHAGNESGVIFGICIVVEKDKKNQDKYARPDSVVHSWQYHTANSIQEKWPIVVPNNWIEQLLNHQILLER